MSIASQEEKRSIAAWKDVDAAARELDRSPRYLSMVKGLPAMIINNGMGQALAFLYAKGGDEKADMLLYQQLSRWLVAMVEPSADKKKRESILSCANAANGWNHRQMMRAARESLTYLQWLRRYAEGRFSDASGSKGSGKPEEGAGDGKPSKS